MPIARLYLPLFLIILSHAISAQKHDYLWPLGFGPNKSEFRFFYNFNNDIPTINIRLDTFSTGLYTASYCDKNGQILIFSNGLKIFNKNGGIIENGEGLNPTILEWQLQYSYPGYQSGFFLEDSENPNIIYFISLDFGPHPAQEWPYIFVGQNLLVATIDITANNGGGKVLEKNRVLLPGTLMSPAACRHANGRDWWILVSDADENIHYRILLSPEGFSDPMTQTIGTKPSPLGIGNAIVGNCFSQSGKYYVDAHEQLGFGIFEFDRCSGLLSNEKRYNYPPPPPNHPQYYRLSYGTGCVFSPDEKLFYKTTRYSVSPTDLVPLGTMPLLFQFDLTELNLSATIDTINVIDPLNYWPYQLSDDGFYGAELAPDGRIYIVHEGVSYCTVQYPNVRGKGCKFIHNKPYFGVTIGSAIPYMPNYRLGPLDGSPCDTLGINNIPVANFRVDDSLGMLSRYFYDLSHHEPAAWLWNFGDGATSSDQSPLHTYDSAGIYNVCLTVSNQYGTDTQCRTLYLGVSATDNPESQAGISISPNPFRDRIRIRLQTNLQKPVFRLYDQMGRFARGEILVSEVTEIRMGDLVPGMYFWEVTSEGVVAKSGKLVKTGW